MYFSMQVLRQVWSFDERDEPGGVGMHFLKQFSLSFYFNFSFATVSQVAGIKNRSMGLPTDGMGNFLTLGAIPA